MERQTRSKKPANRRELGDQFRRDQFGQVEKHLGRPVPRKIEPSTPGMEIIVSEAWRLRWDGQQWLILEGGEYRGSMRDLDMVIIWVSQRMLWGLGGTHGKDAVQPLCEAADAIRVEVVDAVRYATRRLLEAELKLLKGKK